MILQPQHFLTFELPERTRTARVAPAHLKPVTFA